MELNSAWEEGRGRKDQGCGGEWAGATYSPLELVLGSPWLPSLIPGYLTMCTPVSETTDTEWLWSTPN